MTGDLFLDWATLAVSLFNTFLLLWLGLIVLLSAERRTWGLWLAGGSLLSGGVFFVSHSAILGHGPSFFGWGLDFWWHVGWLPIAALPFAWYVMMLWYTGFWDASETRLHRRHRPWLLLMLVLAAGLIGLLLFTNALPSFWQIVQLKIGAGDVPLLIMGYPLYVLLCIGLSLDVLRRPGPTARVMGDLARRRARPWLMGASVALLAASLLVTVVIVWIALRTQRGSLSRSYASVAFGVAWLDLLIASLIAGAVVLLGQAIVSYEVFTGKTLPRRGLSRHWHRAVILAAGYGTTVGGSLALQLRPVYSLLLAAVMMVSFFALLVWRSYAERERHIEHLRPFVSSQRLYDHLLTESAPPHVDGASPFRALCEDVLGARVAYLVALGPLAPLAGPALVYPDEAADPPSVTEIARQLESPRTMGVPLDPNRCCGATWAVPLWSTRGLIGVLLLGEKRDGGLYTQEEIEIARASGERLIDTQASAEMARRLMALQRQRMAESQVLDQRTRRVLHDEVLPKLHATMLTMSGEGGSAEAVASLADAHRQIADLLHEIPAASAPEVTRLGLPRALRQAVDEEFGTAFDDVTWEIDPDAEQRAQAIPSLTAEVLFYAAREAIRNAARHGRDEEENRPLRLRLSISWREGLELVIEDDGVGLRPPEGSHTDSGHGLALHSTMMAVVGGTLVVESGQDTGTRVTLALPQDTWRMPGTP